MKTTFTGYYLRAFIHPAHTFSILVREQRRLPFSFLAILVMITVYTLVYVFLILGGGQPFHPWLNIPEAVYYRYNVFFLAPSVVLGWILSTGVIQLLSRLAGGRGTFEDTFVLLGFSISIASWSTGLHDLVTSFLGAVGIMDQHAYEVAMNTPTAARNLLWLLMLLYLLWFGLLFFRSVIAAQHITGWRGLLIGTAGFLAYQLFFLLFNR